VTVQLMTKAAYARHRGCDEKAVRKAIAEGRISLINGKIDPDVADIQWAKNTRARADSGRKGAASDEAGGVAPTEAPAAPTPPKNDYNDFRTRREKAEAERAELETARMAGRLVDRDTVERAVFDAFRALRDAVMASGARAAPKLIGMSDAREIERVVSDEQRKAFDGWEARMLERLPAKEGA
jgi:hypothetical protein